jgi:hypothetical protein
MKKKAVFGSIVFSVVLGAGLVGGSAGSLPPSDFDHSHALFGKVLDAFVADGWVNYAGLEQNPADLKAYLGQLASISRTEFVKWSEPEQIAFLSNLYNAATLQLIIDHYPVQSIKKIGGRWKGPWKQEVVSLFGEKVTLDHVEHDLIRKDYNEPRVHFALVCAARSCPPLRGEPYTPEKLDEQLEDQGRIFMNTPSKNRVDLENRTAYLSKIFKWFGGDFEEASGSVPAFVRPYFPKDISKQLEDGKFAVEYMDYDWALNDLKARDPS